MPSGAYTRTEKHKTINVGRKYPNRKKYFKGKTIYIKTCEFCQREYTANYKNHLKSRFCSLSCSAKSRPEFIFSMKGKTTSEKQKQSIKSGADHPRWIEDRTISMEKHRLRGTSEWSEWRKSVFERDNYTCCECGIKGGTLEPHHIIPLRTDITKVFEIDNGITLCRPCHVKTIRKEEDFIEKYQQLLTKL